MHKPFQLALAAALLAAAAAHAQITDPNKLISPPPTPHARAQAAPDNLQWLWQYAGEKKSLTADPRFDALLSDNLKAPQAFWSIPGTPLADAARAFLAGSGTFTSPDNRHLLLTGCVVAMETDARVASVDHCSPQRGLLWFDLGRITRDQTPLIVFAALRWNEQGRALDEPCAPYTLWIFTSRPLDPQQLPQALKDALNTFTAHGGRVTPTITNAILVDPNGVPHILGTLAAGVTTGACTKPNAAHSGPSL